MIIDGVDLSTIGVVVGDRSPSRSAAGIQQVIVGAPGAWRRKRLGRQAPDPLIINLSGAIVGDLLTGGTPAELRANIDQFKYIMRPDYEMAIRWSDAEGDTPVREWLGYRSTLRIDDIVPGWETEAVRFQLQLICPDPFARETSEQTETDSGATPLLFEPDIGTAPMPVVITLVGTAIPMVNPVIHYRNGADVDVTTLSYSGSLSDTDTLVIDTEHFTAELNGSNAGGDIAGTYFDIDPADGDYLGSPTAPDVQVTFDSGTAGSCELAYRRRYW